MEAVVGRQLPWRLSPAQQFMLTSLLILLAGMVVIGWWIGTRIERGVLSRTAYTTALYVDSFISPPLQELRASQQLSPAAIARLEELLADTALGDQIVALKIWGTEGQVIYSPDADLIGQVFAPGDGLRSAWAGQVSAEISDLEHAENVNERARAQRLLEIYSPVRAAGTGQVIGVVEFYQPVVELEMLIASAQAQSWLVVISITMVMYLLLGGYVELTSRTIVRQRGELEGQIQQLQVLLEHNHSLNERLRQAAARTTAINERNLRRIGAELHDGPLQHLALALLRLDRVALAGDPPPGAPVGSGDVQAIQLSLQQAMQEIRGIAAGLSLPHIERLSPAEVVARVVRTQEQATGVRVTLLVDQAPAQAGLATKITLYRIVQEALSNAYRHAGGQGLQVALSLAEHGQVLLTVCDAGPGMGASAGGWDEQMGVTGMRERVFGLGGEFTIISNPGQGTCIRAMLPLEAQLEPT